MFLDFITRLKRIKLGWVFFYCFFCSLTGRAQVEHFALEYLSKEHGLSNSEITSVVQDKQGYIWVGTRGGLNRYDGYSVKVFRNIPGDTNSLCDNAITTLFVDSQGLLWIGTESNGLSIYHPDKDHFSHYSFILEDPNSLSFNYVTSIAEDENGAVWVGTLMGLNKFEKDKNNFKRYLRSQRLTVEQNLLDSLTLRNAPDSLIFLLSSFVGLEQDYAEFLNEIGGTEHPFLNEIIKYAHFENSGAAIKVLEADRQGALWMGFEREGLGRFNPENMELKMFRHDPEDEKTLSSNKILSLCLDGKELWIGTMDGGINRMDMEKEVFSTYQQQLESKFVKCLIKDRQNKIWAGGDEGLSLFNEEKNVFEPFNSRLNNEKKLLSSDVSAILEDMQGNLWIASYQGGLNFLKEFMSFKQYKFYEGGSAPVSKTVSSVLKDSNGNLWVGFFTTGVDLFLKDNKQKKYFRSSPPKPFGLGAGTVFKIFEDSRKNIWFGTYEGGLQRYDKQTQRFINYEFEGGEKHIKDVRDISEDQQGNIWIAVHGDGIKKYDPKNKRFFHYRANYNDWENALSNDWVYTIHCDRKGRVWAGSVAGVSVLDQRSGTFVSYNKSNSNLSHDQVQVIEEDHLGRIWVGTENGLNLFLEEEKKFEVFTQQDGLPDNSIKGILEDEKGLLWVSTNSGLSKCDWEKGVVSNYCGYDGLQPNEFFSGAYALSGSGSMFFGGKNGLNSFVPDQVMDNQYLPPVIITDLKLFNRSVPVKQKAGAILSQHISKTESIELPYSKNVLSLEFTAFNYVTPKRNSYAYMLEGFEREWNYVGGKREATYTNLDPGIYTFRVKAANNDGVWNEQGASLQIVVKPPFWKTGWAYTLYLCLFLLILYWWRRETLAKIRVRSRMEMDEMKLRFFANISHEFRTPLTLILGPLNHLNSISETFGATQKELLTMMNRNGQRLLRLINQLINIYELDAGYMKLKVAKGDVVEFSRSVSEAFRYQAQKRNLQYRFCSNISQASGFFDADKLEKILYNLIANAFKYTPNGGAVSIDFFLLKGEELQGVPRDLLKKAGSDPEFVKIKVQDSGVGIPLDFQEKVFGYFFRVENQNLQKTGTGIGLSLARQLARAHYGDILLESEDGKGCSFTVMLPINKVGYKEKEIVQDPIKNNERLVDLQTISLMEEDQVPLTEDSPDKKEKPILLIVEDSEDIRTYIKYNFGSCFRVEEAEDGEKAIQKAFDLIPDVVVSDVMMPLMDGITLCAKLKKDQRTNHIPVILLTARTDEDFQLKGLKEGGADDYITKPFNLSLLSARIKNILDHRERVRKNLLLEFQVKPSEVKVSSSEDVFLKLATEVVEKNISDLSFGVGALGREVGLSQTSLYRKLQSVLGISANQFIKTIRLKRAAQLLEAKRYSVTEVAYMVGFNDPKYFSKTFKKEFGLLPSEYVGSKIAAD